MNLHRFNKFNVYLGISFVVIFLFWFIRGYHTVLLIDTMKEMMGNVVEIKVPNNLFDVLSKQIEENFLLHRWHVGRWSPDILPYIFYQTIGKSYVFFMRDPIAAIHITQGFIVSFYMTLLVVTVLLYIKKILNLEFKSYRFLFTLFVTNITVFFFLEESFYWNQSLGVHYVFTMLLMLVTVYPYFILMLEKKWIVNTFKEQTIFYILIILTTMSSTAVGFLFMFIQCLIGLMIFLTLPPQPLKIKLTMILTKPTIPIKMIFFGIISWVVIAFFEYRNGINFFYYCVGDIEKLSILSLFKSNFKPMLLSCMNITLGYFYLMIPLAILYKIKTTNELKNIFKMIIFLWIIAISYVFFFSFFRDINAISFIYSIPYKLLFAVGILLLGFYIIYAYPSPIVYAFICLMTFSRYLDIFPKYTSYEEHFKSYQFYEDLYQQNQNSGSKDLVIYNSPVGIDSNFVEVLQEFTRDIGIIDRDKVIVLKKLTNK